jgi:chromosome segregation ATPase
MSSPAPRRRASRVLLVLALLVAVIGGIVAGLVATDQRDAAGEWRARAETLEEQRDGLVDERDLLADRLDEALAALGTSERDVADLEERVRTLAEEKARAEDTATTVQVERDVFLELSELIGEATGSLDACVSQLFELQTASVAAFNRANLGQSVDVDALNDRADEVTRFCNQARSAAASAQAAADQLPRP